MGRLIAFLGVGVFVGLLASVFQIPLMIPIVLVIIWCGMGCGLNIVLGLIGAVLVPLAIAVPMWFLPGPNQYHRLYPPDDTLFAEFYYVDGAPQLLAADQQAYAKALAANPTDESLKAPTLYKANMEAVDQASTNAQAPKHFAVWPTMTAYLTGLVLCFLVSMFNTVTTRPFRPAGGLGKP